MHRKATDGDENSGTTKLERAVGSYNDTFLSITHQGQAACGGGCVFTSGSKNLGTTYRRKRWQQRIALLDASEIDSQEFVERGDFRNLLWLAFGFFFKHELEYVACLRLDPPDTLHDLVTGLP